jgi:hypothetical protein
MIETPITARQLLDFAESKPPKTTYNFGDVNNCFLAQFAANVLGYEKPNAGTVSVFDEVDPAQKARLVDLDQKAMSDVLFSIRERLTFGRVATKLKEFISDHPQNLT